MNTIVTSREAILEAGRQLIRKQGTADISIRSIAAACGVSVGSIYNYFDSKNDLITAAVESVWSEIFHASGQENFEHFSDCVEWIFDRIKKGAETYPGFFTLHSMAFFGKDRDNGRILMEKAWSHMQGRLLHILLKDRDIRPDAFEGALSPEGFVEILFSLVLSSLIRQNYESGAILEMLRKLLY